MKTVNHIRRGKRGSALVEYGLIVAGVALVGAVAVSVFGNKVGGIVGTSAALLPGQTSADSGPIVVGKVVKTKTNADGSIGIDSSADNNMQDNFDIENPEDLVTDASSN